jgi:hypothetical protein
MDAPARDDHRCYAPYMSQLSYFFTLGALPFGLMSCVDRSCTEMGCSDGAWVTLAPEGALATGAYEMTIVTPEQTHVCDFKIPEDLPPRGSITSITCQPTLDLGLQQKAECTETRTGDSVSQSCTPIPDRYTLTLNLPGTPQSVSIEVLRDGAELLDVTRSLSYVSARPNGPGCEPVCRQANIDLTLPE